MGTSGKLYPIQMVPYPTSQRPVHPPSTQWPTHLLFTQWLFHPPTRFAPYFHCCQAPQAMRSMHLAQWTSQQTRLAATWHTSHPDHIPLIPVPYGSAAGPPDIWKSSPTWAHFRLFPNRRKKFSNCISKWLYPPFSKASYWAQQFQTPHPFFQLETQVWNSPHFQLWPRANRFAHLSCHRIKSILKHSSLQVVFTLNS